MDTCRHYRLHKVPQTNRMLPDNIRGAGTSVLSKLRLEPTTALYGVDPW